MEDLVVPVCHQKVKIGGLVCLTNEHPAPTNQQVAQSFHSATERLVPEGTKVEVPLQHRPAGQVSNVALTSPVRLEERVEALVRTDLASV